MTGMEALQHCMQNKETYIRRKVWHYDMYILVQNEHRGDDLPPVTVTTSHVYNMVHCSKVTGEWGASNLAEMCFEHLFFDDWIVVVS
jgi:hypothetical protein